MTRTAQQPPGSRLPGAVQSFRFVRDPVGFIERGRKRWGSVFRVSFLGFPNFVYVTDPGLVRVVYSADRTVGRAGAARRDFLAPLVGEHSLLCTEGEEWLRHRKMLGPVFHRNHVDGYAEEIAAIAAREIESWPSGTPFSLRPRMQRITLEVILRLVFGVADAARLEQFRHAIPRVLEPAGGTALWLVPPTAWSGERPQSLLRKFPNPMSQFLRARDRLDALIYDEIAKRRDRIDESAVDVMSLLLRSTDERGRALDDVELRDQLVTLLEAGHETTATALAWAFERLLRHPAALMRLREELSSDAIEYADAVAREALRTRPVVTDTPRLLAGPLELGDYVIPGGWCVAPAISSVQLDPRATDEPGEFRPERFLDGGPHEGWIPFGGGKRHCVGSHLALLEMRIVITEVIGRLELEAVGPAERQRLHHITLTPDHGACVIARARPREIVGSATSRRSPPSRGPQCPQVDPQ